MRWVLVCLAGCAGPGAVTPPVTGVDRPADTVDAPADTVDPPAPSPSPGAFALRRLGRDEYDRTIIELFGVDHHYGDAFPADPKTGGFDNVADGLAITPLWFDVADRAAAAIAAEATSPPMPAPVELAVELATLTCESSPENRVEGPTFALHRTGTALTVVHVPAAGTWQLTVEARFTHEHSDPLSWNIEVNGAIVYHALVPVAQRSDRVTVDVPLNLDGNLVGVTFNNDYQSVDEDRNLFVDAITVAGPVDWSPDPTAAYARTMICELDVDPVGCSRVVLEALLPRAWRRPVLAAEVDGLMVVREAAAAVGDPPGAALAAAIHAALVSPHFLLLVEDAATDAATPVDDWQLASRLSYFLWGSMPDDALFAAAAAGALRDDAGLDREVTRMLADPRAAALIHTFAAQWLAIDRVASATPDPHHEGWSHEVLDAMQDEMRAFFGTFIAEERPLTELLTATDGYLNPALARFLEIPFAGADLGPYDAAAWGRGGWLTQAGLLTALSLPDRPSVARRGAWALGALLCDEPDPPPPGVPALAPTDGTAHDLRGQLAAHRENPACATCHDAIDPIGLTMQRFDEVGRYREQEAGGTIDQSGALPDGTPVDGVIALQAAIAADPTFLRCATTKAFTWAHHRVPGPEDQPWVEHVYAAMLEDGASLHALARAIAKAPSFRMRQQGMRQQGTQQRVAP